jgi:hypothetical protein
MRSLPAVLLLALLPTFAADKKAPLTAEMSDETLRIIGTLYNDPESVVKLLGVDPGFPMIVVDVRAINRSEEKLQLWRDDFTLLSNKDGQRSQPLTPSQLAGQGSIMVSSRGYSAGGIATNNQAPVWSDGPVGTGRPRRIGDEDTAVGGADPGGTAVETRDGAKEKPNPLLKLFEQRVLPEGEIAEESKGLLYFLLDGKHKPKHLELIYKAKGRRQVILDFEP